MSRRTFNVTPDGVGRRDWSQNVEMAVQAEIRSHQYRYNWTVESAIQGDPDALDTLPFPEYHVVLLEFQDKAGNLLGYVPSDIKYLIYDVWVTGDYNALTLAALEQYRYPLVLTDPNAAYIDTVAKRYGYGEAEIHLSEGHPCEAGIAYMLSLNQWSEKDEFRASFIVHAYTDVVVG